MPPSLTARLTAARPVIDPKRRQDDSVTGVTVRLGPEITPGTREYEWVASIIAARERRTGEPTGWNGRLYEQPDNDIHAAAHGDGSLSVNRDNILQPVLQAYDARRELSADELRLARRGAIVILHEVEHLGSYRGDDTAPDAVELDSPEEEAVAESLADTRAIRDVNPIIVAIGMHTAVPGVLDADDTITYAAYNAGMDTVVTGLSASNSPRSSRSTWTTSPSTRRRRRSITCGGSWGRK
jgi:hypothetical protein